MQAKTLMKFRRAGKDPRLAIKISLCPDDKFKEPVLHLKRGDNLKVLHGLHVDICYWTLSARAVALVPEVAKVKPKTISLVNHKTGECVMVYFKGEQCMDNQSFLYDWKENRPYE